MFQSFASLFDRMGGRTAFADLLRHFYTDVRPHEEIGPIFAAHVSDWCVASTTTDRWRTLYPRYSSWFDRIG